MRVVHAEDSHAVVHPVAQDAQDLLGQTFGIAVEPQRVDVLVLLRRVLGVGDGAVGADREPRLARSGPWVVGCGLQCKVQRHLHAQILGACDEGVEVVDCAQIRMDRVMTTSGGTDGPRGAGIVRSGGQSVVGSLAVHRPHRVDRRQVHDIETHGGDRGKPLLRVGEGATARRVQFGALASGEQFVPGAEERAATIGVDRPWAAWRFQIPDRVLAQHPPQRLVQARRQSFFRGLGDIAQTGDGLADQGLVGDVGTGDTPIIVLQGDPEEHPDKARVLARFQLSNLPPGPTHERIEVEFAMDCSGLANVHARDLFSGREIAEQVDARDAVQKQHVA